MTEISYIWTTGGGGDAGATVTRADWIAIGTILAACHGFEGVAPRYWTWGTLTVTAPAANTARVSSGAAMVDGHPYVNDANLDINIPSAVGAGNTRIDRLVLEAVMASQTVRVVRIAGTDAVAPVVPDVPAGKLIPGTDYAILLYQVTVDTSGNVTISTDERVWAKIATGDISATAAITGSQLAAAAGITGAQLAAAAGIVNGQLADATITTAKISATAAITGSQLAAAAGITGAQLAAAAAITDAQLQYGKVSNRQGGSATDWSSAGTSNYAPTSARIQVGVVNVSWGSGVSRSEVTVTFPVAFSNAPIVYASITEGASSPGVLYLSFVTTPISTQVVVVGVRNTTSGTDSAKIWWLAIGPP